MIYLSPQAQTAYSQLWPCWQVFYVVCDPENIHDLHEMARRLGFKPEERFSDACKLPHYILKPQELHLWQAEGIERKDWPALEALAKIWARAGHKHGQDVAPAETLHGEHAPAVLAVEKRDPMAALAEGLKAIATGKPPAEVEPPPPDEVVYQAPAEEPVVAFEDRPAQVTTDGPPAWMLNAKQKPKTRGGYREPKPKPVDPNQLDLFS